METLVLDKKTARELYPKAAPEFRAIMESTFGVATFSTKTIDRIKTFEDACLETGENPSDRKFTEGTTDDIAYQKLKVIAKALNPKGWVPDWNSTTQRKWRPWFYLNNPGFRFFDSGCGIPGTGSTGGSRLCLESEELSDYSAKQFLPIWKDFLA